MVLSRPPRGPLRPFIERLWLSDEAVGGAGGAPRVQRERVLPSGAMHVVVRLTDHPLRLFEGEASSEATEIGCSIIGGARSSYYVRDISQPARAVGAMLYPGASLPLLGISAEALAERHTSLEDAWGPAAAGELRERLLAERSPEAVLARFEDLLAQRLPRVRAIHPAVAHALARFTTTSDVGAVVEETGYSHRRFISVFREAVGLSPKRYCRVRRFQQVLAQLEARPDAAWSQLAFEAGYSDQSHFVREFGEIAGLSPGRYRALSPAHGRHVPVEPR
ncbi:MAG: helix-turn-helix domain-containing protein [Kofleriaceae bacterium]